MKRVLSALRLDSWTNLFSGAFTKKDPRTSTKFAEPAKLTEADLTAMYNNDGVMKRIVNIVPDMCTMKPWSIEGDTDNDIWNYLNGIQAQQAMRRALRWAGCYGGAVILIGVDDGSSSFEMPLNLQRVKKLSFLRVFDRYSVNGSSADYETDPLSPRYGRRKFYRLIPRGRAFAATEIRVHYTRIIEVDGVDCNDITRANNDGWGESNLTPVWSAVRRYTEGLDNADLILRDFVQGVLTIKNLADLISAPEGEDLVRKRLDILDMSRHVLNTMLLDEGEEYTKVTSTVTGINEVVNKFESAVAAAAGMPVTVVFGQSPGGMNATGNHETRNFYDTVATYREEKCGPIIQALAQVVLAAQDYKGKVPKDIKGKGTTAEPYIVEPCYEPLWQETAKEQADTRKVVAETDQIYLDSGVLDPSEVAISRFGGDSYSIETKLLVEREPPTEQPDKALPAAGAVDADGNPIAPPAPGAKAKPGEEEEEPAEETPEQKAEREAAEKEAAAKKEKADADDALDTQLKQALVAALTKAA